MPVLQNIVYHTVNVSQLILVLHPAPWECYDDLGHVLEDRFAQFCPDLMDFLRAIKQPKSICFALMPVLCVMTRDQNCLCLQGWDRVTFVCRKV